MAIWVSTESSLPGVGNENRGQIMVMANIRNNCHPTLFPLLHMMDISPSISVSEYGFGLAWSILDRVA